MGNILCVPKRNKTRQSTDRPTGGRFSRWISGKFQRPSSTEDLLPLPDENDEVLAHAKENNVHTTVHSPDSYEESFDSADLLSPYTDSGDHHTKDSLASSEGKSPSPVFEDTTETPAIQIQTTCVALTRTLTATTKEVSFSRCVISDTQSNHDAAEIEPTISQNELDISAKHQPKVITLAAALPGDIKDTNPLSTHIGENHLKRSVAQLTDNDEIKQTPSESANATPSSRVLGNKTLREDTPEPETEQNNTASQELLSSKTEILDAYSLDKQRDDCNKEISLTDYISENIMVEMKEKCDTVKEVKNATDIYHDKGNQCDWNRYGTVAARHGVELVTSDESLKSINNSESKVSSIQISLAKLSNVLKTEIDSDSDGPTETYSNEPKLIDRGEHGDIKRLMPVAKASIDKKALSEDYQNGYATGRRCVMEVTTRSNSQNRSKVRSNEIAKRKPEIGGLSSNSKQMLGIAPAKSFYRLDNEPTPMCRKHSLYNGLQFQQVKRKVSDFKVPQLPPLLPDVPLQLYRKPHVNGIPNVARDEARGKVTWRQIENKSSYGGQCWRSTAPVFEPPAQALGERLLGLHGSVEKLRRSWVIPQCRQIETLKLENDIYPELWLCPDMRWRYNMDTHTDRGYNMDTHTDRGYNMDTHTDRGYNMDTHTDRGSVTNRRQHMHIPKTNKNSALNVQHRHRKRTKAKSKTKGGNLARWSRYDDLSSLYEETSF